MKKTLLSLAAMLLLAGGASAQTAKSATVYTDKVDATPVSVVKKAKAPMMKEEESKYVALGFTGSDNPSQMNGFPTWESASMVMSGLDNGVDYDFSGLAGYKIVGLNFAVTANLGEQAGAFAFVYQDENDQGTELDSPYLFEDENYKVSTVENQQLTLQWNGVAFAEPYEITGEELAFQYGLVYEQVKGNGTTQEEFPFLTGVSTDSGVEGMFLAYGKPSSKYQEGLYTLNDPNDDTESDKHCLCMQLILETPGGSTVILGLNGSDKPVAMQYFSLDGKKLSAPQKGINVVKMSDGTSKKVLVK